MQAGVNARSLQQHQVVSSVSAERKSKALVSVWPRIRFISYSTKRWRRKTLENLANQSLNSSMFYLPQFYLTYISSYDNQK